MSRSTGTVNIMNRDGRACGSDSGTVGGTIDE